MTTKIAFLSMVFVCIAASPAVADDGAEDWQFAASIYGWLPDIGGHTELPLGGSGTIDVDVGTILDHLKMTGQGSIELHKGRWGAFTDIVYLDVGESASQTRGIEIGGQPLPASVTAAVDFDLKSVFWTLAASYRVAARPDATVDLLAGARLASLEQTLDWQFAGSFGPVAAPPTSGSRAASIDQWDAIVGVKGRLALDANRKWGVPYYLDVGTGDSELTWQAVLGVSYAFAWGNVGAVWRYLDYDLEADGPIKDIDFSGPAVGATFRW